MKASQMQVGSNISILMKGPWGHGKTIAACSFALLGPVYLAYFDKSKPIELIDYYRRLGRKGEQILDNIEFDVYGSHNANEYINKMIQFSKEGCRYVAVITDSITNLTSAAVNWSLSFRDDRKKKEILRVIPDWDEYKVETSIVTMAIDVFRDMPIYTIFTCHPIPVTRIEGSGQSVKVSKALQIVTYGSKVAGIVPGTFSEIYHFSKQSTWDSNTGNSATRYIVSTDAIGDDFAKSNLGLTGDIDITKDLFYEAWKRKLDAHNKERDDEVAKVKQAEEANLPDYIKQAEANGWKV